MLKINGASLLIAGALLASACIERSEPPLTPASGKVSPADDTRYSPGPIDNGNPDRTNGSPNGTNANPNGTNGTPNGMNGPNGPSGPSGGPYGPNGPSGPANGGQTKSR